MANRVLVVDDALDDRELIKAMLTSSGCEVLTAVNGREGLALARAQKPDLIIADVLMPEMDGFALFKELKKDKATASIPVVILTVRGRMRDSFEVMGVNSFIPKPFETEILFSEVSRFVKAGPSAPAAARPAEKPAVAQPAPAPRPVEASPADVRHKVLIFGSEDNILKKMTEGLEQAKCRVLVVQDEGKLQDAVASFLPDVSLVQINGHTHIPPEEIVSMIGAILVKRAPSPASRKSQIVLYKVDQEVSGVDDVGSSLADTETVLERCSSRAETRYIGSYSPVLFMSRMKEVLR